MQPGMGLYASLFYIYAFIFHMRIKLLKNIYLSGLLLAFCTPLFAQFTTCDTNLVNAHLNPAGYKRLYVPTQPCSMYFYNPTPKTGINAHRDAANLNVPMLLIESAQENSDVSAALYAQGVYFIVPQVWLGLTDSATPLVWRTFAGNPAPAYTNWSAGEPNNLSPSCRVGTSCALCAFTDPYYCQWGEDCVIMNASGQWLDNTCSSSNVLRIAVLELNTCPVLTHPRDTTICSASPISVTASVPTGGTAPYTYTWNPGALTGATVTINPATTSTYTVEASDIYHCKADSTFTVTVSSSTPPTINISQATVCRGTNTTVSLSAVSATATYAWSFGSGANVVSGSGAGPYAVNWTNGGTKTINVTISDNGCTAHPTTTVTVDTAAASFTLNPASNICVNQNVTVTASNVTPTANYTWSFSGANVVSGSGSGPYTINWSAAGPETVQLTVTDNGCTATASVNTTVATGLTPSFTLNPSAGACPGQAVGVTLSGAVSPTATYNWNFNGGNILSGSGGGPYSISWGSNGTKNIDLTVTDGCTGTASQSININSSITANAGADIQLCPGVTGNLGSAPVAGYTYSWSPSTGLSSASVADPTINIASNPTGSAVTTQYIVTVSSGICSAVDTVLVTIYPDINNNFTVNPTSVCVGNNATVTYSGTPSATATYTWNFGTANVVSGTGAGPYTLNWSSAGAQTITLSTTDNTCTATMVTNTVNVGTPIIANVGTNQTVCSGISVQLGAAPQAGANYSWTPAANLSNAAIADPIFQQTNTTQTAITNNYMLIADAGGCPDTAYVTVIVNPASAIAITPVGATSFCLGDSVVLQENDPQLVSYLWSNSDTTSAITVFAAGTYTVSAYDANGCQHISSPSVTVSVLPSPAVALATGGEQDESCWNANDGALTVQASGGSPAYSYVWGTTPAQNGASATNLAPGSYPVTVTDANGCTATGSYTVNAATYLGIQLNSINNVTCFGKSDGSVYASGVGGAAPYTYLWSNGATGDSAVGLRADSVSVLLTDNNGCKVDTSVLITQPAKITISAIGSLNISYGDTLPVMLSVTPASLGYYYNWSPSSSLSCLNCPNPVAYPTQTSTYYLTVTDAAQTCSDTFSLTVYVNPAKDLYIPNAFTPNGDGVNDLYQVYARGVVKFFEIMIFDRWGEMIYRTNDMGTGWDGTYKGTKVEGGEYVYHVTITFLDGQTINNKGALTVIR